MGDVIPQPDDASDDVLDVQYDTFDGGSHLARRLRRQGGRRELLRVDVRSLRASRCPSSRASTRTLGDEVTFVGIAVDDTADDAADLVERTGVTYDTGLDPDAPALPGAWVASRSPPPCSSAPTARSPRCAPARSAKTSCATSSKSFGVA